MERPDHHHLTPDDECAFFGEYTPRKGWQHSTTNQLILNLKKRPSVAKGTLQWPHKLSAIRDVSAAIRAAIKPEALASSLFVPIPGSKTPTHPDFDQRMLAVAQQIGRPARAAEVLRTNGDRDAMHENVDRRDLDKLAATITVDPAAIPAGIQRVFLLDDMLTTGCSFRVCKALLRQYLPETPVAGLFVSRRIIVPDPLNDFTALDW